MSITRDRNSFAAALLTFLLLTGCGDQRQQQLAECTMKAIAAYPNEQAPYDFDAPIDNYIGLCMTAAGYTSYLDDSRCQADLSQNEYCYISANPIGGMIAKVEIWLNQELMAAASTQG